MNKHLALVLMAGLACSLGGCKALGYVGYLVAPDDSQKSIEAEYKGLEEHSVAVVVFADQSIEYYYPSIRYELSLTISDELRKNVKNARVIDVGRVVKYQDDHLDWNNRPLVEMGRVLGADYVLYVALNEFSTREPGSVHLFRGRARGQANLYETIKPLASCKVWQVDDLGVVYPDGNPVGMLDQDDREFRYQTEKRMAELLAKKFYKHKPAPTKEADRYRLEGQS